MASRLRTALKINRKTFLNPSGWIDLESLKQQNKTIWGILKNLFSAPKPTREETFEEAKTRLGLTEKDIKRLIITYRYYALGFVFIALVLFCYSFYLLFRYVTILGWMLGMVVTAMFLAQAFRYDFWSFQMKSRRLGVSFQAWKESVLGGKENSK